MTTQDTWKLQSATHTTTKSTEECQKFIGGSKKYGMGGKWTKDGQKYLALNGHLSRSGMPSKLKTKTGEIPVSSTDIVRLVEGGYLKGVAPIEFDE